MDFFSAGTPSGTSNQTLLSKLGLSFTEDDRFVMSESTFPGFAFEFVKKSGNYDDPQTKRLQTPKNMSFAASRAMLCLPTAAQPRPEVYKSCLLDWLALVFRGFVLTPGIQARGG